MSMYKMFHTASSGITTYKSNNRIYGFRMQFPTEGFSVEEDWEVAVHKVYFVPRGGAKQCVGLYSSAAEHLALGDPPFSDERLGNKYKSMDYFKLGADGYMIDHQKTYVPCFTGTLTTITFFFYELLLPELQPMTAIHTDKLETDRKFVYVVLHFRRRPA